MSDLNEWIDRLLSMTDIIAVIGRYLPLKRKGATHWGNCPFHHEKEPSFSVSADKQLYHCFGCKESGNVITFISKLENISRWDAIRLLAKDAGLELPTKLVSDGVNDEARDKKRQRLLALMRDAAKIYHQNLSLPEGKIASEYLKKRGVARDLIIKFGLGVSAGWTQIIEKLEELGYSKEEQKEAGLLAHSNKEQKQELEKEEKKETGKTEFGAYDIFVDRLIFPIIDNYGDVIAFGGRVLKANAQFAKYRNTSNTILFDKSRIVYGINLLKKRKREKGLPYIIIAEGYMDVIALHKAGFDMAVASMGTALTLQQARQLRHYSTNIYISYDGDSAGKGATLRGLDVLASCGHNVRVISLPDGMDPDDVINKHGAEYYKKLIDTAPDLTTFKIDTIKKTHDIGTEEGKSKFAIEAVKVVRALIDPVEQDRFYGLISKYSGFSVEVLKRQAEVGIIEVEGYVPNAAFEKKDNEEFSIGDKAVFFILSALVHEQKYANTSKNFYEYLTKDWQKAVYSFAIDRIKSEPKISISGLFSLPECDGAEDIIQGIINYDFKKDDSVQTFDDCINTLERKHYEDQYNNLRNTNDPQLIIEMTKIQQRLNKFKK